MKECLIKYSYPKELIKKGIEKAMSINMADLLNTILLNFNKEVVASNNHNNIVHISTFNTNFHNNDKFIHSYLNCLRSHQSTADVYENRMLLSKRQPY